MELKISRDGSGVALPPEFDSTRLVTIGSDPLADLTLEDEAVSPFQVRLTRRGALWWLRDLDPSTGSQLNGSLVSKSTLLQDEDVLTFGDHELKVVLDEGERTAAAALRGVADPDQDPRGQAHLRVEGGETYSLSQDVFLIGKDESADLQLSGWNAPGQLAVIVRGQEGHYLMNLAGSSVFHQAKPVELQVELKNGERLEFREIYATFHTGASS